MQLAARANYPAVRKIFMDKSDRRVGWADRSAGRSLALQARGRAFKSRSVHHLIVFARQVEKEENGFSQHPHCLCFVALIA